MVSSSCFLLSCLAKLAVVGLRAALWPGVGCWGGVGGGTSGTSVVTKSSCDDAGGAHCHFFMDLVCFLFFFGSTRCSWEDQGDRWRNHFEAAGCRVDHPSPA